MLTYAGSTGVAVAVGRRHGRLRRRVTVPIDELIYHGKEDLWSGVLRR